MSWVIRGRTITLKDVQTVQQLVVEQGNAGRWGLARALCELWQWRAHNGALKARSALAVLTELERRGHLSLPPPIACSVHLNAAAARSVNTNRPIGKRLDGPLSHYRPLHWELVNTAAQRRVWRELLDQHHYLGAPRLVGANLKYLVWNRPGELLGALGWQSAVHHLGCRDRLLGWNATQRERWLDRVVNGVRFLLLPWVKVPNLASVILSESLAWLQRDWWEHYGVTVGLAESFVDPRRFSGVSYRAANWVCLGGTRGFAKRQGNFVEHGQIKEVYVYVLEPRLRRWVHADPQQPLLTREYLLAQRPGEIIPPLTRRTRMKKINESWQPKLPPSWDLNVADLESVVPELNAFTGLFRGAFGRTEPAQLCELYLQGLLSNTEKKNSEAMALALAGPEVVRNLQRFVSKYQWNDAWMRQKHWELTAEDLSGDQGVWSIDASEFAKKGRKSVGVAPQYCGALGKTANCQSGVFICYTGPLGHALLDSRLYLPQCWFEPAYAELFVECGIPPQTTFQTKPELAAELLQRLLAQKLFRGRWITCDCSFGNNEAFLEALPKDYYYLAEIACTRKAWLKNATAHPEHEPGGTVESLLELPRLLRWQTHKVAEGEKGPIVAGFARVRVYVRADRTAPSERWLVLRNDSDGQIKYYLSNAPEKTAMRELVRVSAARWPIERCFEENKSELGLDHYEHRSWKGWHRHMRLVFLAQLFLLRLRKKLKKNSCVDLAPSPATHRMEFPGSETGAGVRAHLRSLSSTAQLSSVSIPS